LHLLLFRVIGNIWRWE